MAITKSNKHELSLDHDKPNETMDAHFATLDSLRGFTLGFSNHKHLTRTLLFLALTNVFLSYWNEQKYPLTRRDQVFITAAEKRTVMSFYGVTERSGHVDRTLRSVQPADQCLSILGHAARGPVARPTAR